MKTFTFIVDPSGKEIEVTAETEKEGHKKAWESLLPEERDNVASLECVEVDCEEDEDEEMTEKDIGDFLGGFMSSMMNNLPAIKESLRHERDATLDQKAAALLETIALPSAENWSLLVTGEKETEVVAALNAALVETLKAYKDSLADTGERRDIADMLRPRLAALDKKYPDAGLCDSEASLTIARFFALNLDVSLYNFFRYEFMFESER